MFIRNVEIENNKILWNINLNFLNDNNDKLDTIIFVWENWSWKSTLMNIIYKFSNLKVINEWEDDEKWVFEVEFSDNEMIIINNAKISIGMQTINLSNIFIFTFDLSISKIDYSQINIINTLNNDSVSIQLFLKPQVRSLLKSIFSDVSINFSTKDIKNTTNVDTDWEVVTSIKSNDQLPTEITQMLVDIRAKDNEEQISWQSIHNKLPPNSLREVRTKRFKKAFNIIFKNKLKYLWVKDLEPIFNKWNNEIKISRLSSWEKQIVFRWSYLLKDKQSIKWAIVLIEEPEISLHPDWQKNILNFYKKLFIDNRWVQTSQIFITTHSPYVLDNCDFSNIWLFIFPKGKKLNKLPVYSWKYPSLWVINYFVYNIISVELHIELYNYLKSKKGESKSIKIFDRDFFINECLLPTDSPRYATPNIVSIHTHIRNVIHHWDSIVETNFKRLLIKSIKWMIKIALKY